MTRQKFPHPKNEDVEKRSSVAGFFMPHVVLGDRNSAFDRRFIPPIPTERHCWGRLSGAISRLFCAEIGHFEAKNGSFCAKNRIIYTLIPIIPLFY